MQFKEHVKVISADGKDVGHIRRVVLDPQTDEVKDLVVREGRLLTEDRVVPMDQVKATSDDQVQLSLAADEYDKLPLFEETYYVAADGGAATGATPLIAPAYYAYPPFAGFGPGSTSTGTVPPELMGYTLHHERHIPANTVALAEGAEVKSRDKHEVGKVEQVLTAPNSDQATHLVVADGLLHKTRRIIPLDWVTRIEDHQVLLGVTAQVVENLPAHDK